MKPTSKISCLIACFVALIATFSANGQKVGLVLSGGGASALSHIGVIKALEEHQIPIDYIAGTSMGALIAALYATGYTPAEMQAYFTSSQFEKLAAGGLEDKYVYYTEMYLNDPSMVSIKFDLKNIFQSTLPTNLISPAALDWELMRYFAQYDAAANYDFDSLMIPFRCVASDIENKETYIFRQGNLSTSVRASAAYPFFLKPITVNGKVLFDGGIYNNFPSDILYQDFKPDFMIGSNVSRNSEPPNEDDVISQIKNMLVSKTAFNFPNEACIMIEPADIRSTFEFYNLNEIIDSGYTATLRKMPEIESSIEKRITAEILSEKRVQFRQKRKPFVVDSIIVNGLKPKQELYVTRLLNLEKRKYLNIRDLEPEYYRLYGDNKISSIYPTATYVDSTGYFNLQLDVKPEKSFQADFGGLFSNKPVNTGYIGLRYHQLRKNSLSFDGRVYFGKFFGAGILGMNFKIPSSTPFVLRLSYERNRWNYFRSSSVFFEDIKPSYLIQYEDNITASFSTPIKNKSKIAFGAAANFFTDEYYQTRNFLSTDTADITNFDGYNVFVKFSNNNLNRKLYPSQGQAVSFIARYIVGQENHQPGSTSDKNLASRRNHSWVHLAASVQSFYKSNGKLRLGLSGYGMFSTQPLFNNYTASILRNPVFEALPESRTLFLETFRAYKYLAFGHTIVYSPFENFDLRLEGYLFQPFLRVAPPSNAGVSFNTGIAKRYTMSSAQVVFHSPLGPISASVNYYLNEPEIALEERDPLTLLFHFGYLLFNDRGHY